MGGVDGKGWEEMQRSKRRPASRCVVGADGWMMEQQGVAGTGSETKSSKPKHRNDERRTSRIPSIRQLTSNYHDDACRWFIHLLSRCGIGRHPVEQLFIQSSLSSARRHLMVPMRRSHAGRLAAWMVTTRGRDGRG